MGASCWVNEAIGACACCEKVRHQCHIWRLDMQGVVKGTSFHPPLFDRQLANSVEESNSVLEYFTGLDFVCRQGLTFHLKSTLVTTSLTRSLNTLVTRMLQTTLCTTRTRDHSSKAKLKLRLKVALDHRSLMTVSDGLAFFFPGRTLSNHSN